MKDRLNKKYYLENLGCANCASKIESKLSKQSYITEATIDFAKKKLILTLKDNNTMEENELLSALQKLSSAIEPDVKVIPWDNNIAQGSFPSKSVYSSKNSDHNHSDHSVSDHHEHNHGHNHSHNENSACNCVDSSACAVDNKSVASDKKKLFTPHTIELLRLLTGAVIALIPVIFDFTGIPFYVLYIIGFALLGYEVFSNSFKGILHGQVFDENFLLAIASIGAIFTKQYPEAVAVMFLFQVGELLQDLAVDRSRKRISDAMNIKPEYANIQTEEGTIKVSPFSVAIGDHIVIKPSERVPLDGKVLEGTSYLDTSALTGESVPRKISIGDNVMSGCINGSNTLLVEVTNTYSDSTVAKVLDLVENATSKKSKTENFITKFARIYTPIVVLAAILLAILPPIVTGTYDFAPWIYRACGFLVVSCPCALVISIPLGFFGGIGSASKQGILIKGSNYLDALAHVTTTVFDKTGTITHGTFEVRELNLSDPSLFEYVALAESYSTHPIAVSIVASYQGTLNTNRVTEYEEVAGKGIHAFVDNKEVLLGNSKLLQDHQIEISNKPDSLLGTVTYVAIDGSYIGYITVSDQIKSNAKETITYLKKNGIEPVMLTGDTESNAKAVCNTVGITNYHAELLPADKVKNVENILANKPPKGQVVFLGDGVNDAPVLAMADIGVAMGGIGSDAAIEAADVVLMNDDLSKLPTAIAISKYTKKKVKQNIILSLGIKFIVLILLAFGYSEMWLAIFADVGVSLIAIFNALLIVKRDFTKTIV